MKNYYSAISVIILILLPFLVGVHSGLNAHLIADHYEDVDYNEIEDDIKLEIEEAEEIESLVTNVTSDRKRVIQIIKEENPDKQYLMYLKIFSNNLKKVVFGILSLGIMFIPIFYETGLIIGYSIYSLDSAIMLILTLELISFSLLEFSVFNFFLGLLKNSDVLKEARIPMIVFFLGLSILLVSAYLEIIV